MSELRNFLELPYGELEELNLYGTKVSNASIKLLVELPNLRHVDLRYTRVTRAGIDGLQVALPKCTVLFQDVAPRPPLPESAQKVIEGESDHAVAQWVRSIGGQAVMHSSPFRVAPGPPCACSSSAASSSRSVSRSSFRTRILPLDFTPSVGFIVHLHSPRVPHRADGRQP